MRDDIAYVDQYDSDARAENIVPAVEATTRLHEEGDDEDAEEDEELHMSTGGAVQTTGDEGKGGAGEHASSATGACEKDAVSYTHLTLPTSDLV